MLRRRVLAHHHVDIYEDVAYLLIYLFAIDVSWLQSAEEIDDNYI